MAERKESQEGRTRERMLFQAKGLRSARDTRSHAYTHVPPKLASRNWKFNHAIVGLLFLIHCLRLLTHCDSL